MGTPRTIAELASAQHGVVAHAQMTAAGLSPSAVGRWVACGRLHRVHRGVYAVGHTALAPNARRLAAVLACGPGAVLSHRSAARLWGIRAGGGAFFEVTAPGRSGSRHGPPDVRLHRTRRLDPVDVTTLHGIPVTSLPRTLVDLAAVLSPHALQTAVHEAEVQRILDVAAVHEALERLPGRRGTGILRAAIGVSASDVDHGAFLQAFVRLCRRHHLPRPQTTAHLDAGLPSLTQIDCLFPEAKVIVELDGEQTHRTRRRFHSDRRRDSALAARGYLTVRFTWTRVAREAPAVAAELRAILELRTPSTPVSPSRPADRDQMGTPLLGTSAPVTPTPR